MPAWPGGNCPDCGEYVPENLIHCQVCRSLLNRDLDPGSVEIPEFIPLPEVALMVDVEARGFYVGCPSCHRELRINRKYLGSSVSCNHCHGRFKFDLAAPGVSLVAFYARCPHCEEELRAAMKYLGARVACKHCSGQLHLLPQLV